MINLLDITQQPGIPYMITAYSLGGYAISVYDADSEETVTHVER